MQRRLWLFVAAVMPIAGCTALKDSLFRDVPGYGTMFLSNVKSPLILKTRGAAGLGKALKKEDYQTLLSTQALDDTDTGQPCTESQERIERFAEFGCRSDSQDTLVVVAISGGGGRAALLAAYTMALLEKKYNELSGCTPGGLCENPMVSTVHAFSTISGGSLYASYVARHLAQGDANAENATLLARVARDDGSGITNLGRWSAWDYFFGDRFWAMGPLSVTQALVTDKSYRDYLIEALGFGGYFSRYFTFAGPTLFSELANNSRAPRFYFNATSLESGTPFVLTQRITNLPPPRLPHRTARLDLGTDATQPPSAGGDCSECDPARPLRHSLTLEDIGNSSANFPIVYAAVASAAFPFAVDPLPLRRYTMRPVCDSVEATNVYLSLVDGGVYDNSGLATAVDLFEYLQRYRCVRHLVLIAINNDDARYSEDIAERAVSGSGASWIGLSLPLPTVLSAADSLLLIHYGNKRRAEQLAWTRLETIASRIEEAQGETAGEGSDQPSQKEKVKVFSDNIERLRAIPGPPLPEEPLPAPLERALNELPEPSDIRHQIQNPSIPPEQVAAGYVRKLSVTKYVHFFPVDLSQLSSADPHAIPGGDSYLELASRISTTEWAHEADKLVLEKAAEKLVTTEQRNASAWEVGPACQMEVRRLDEAVAFSLMRASSKKWGTAPDGTGVQDWCTRHSVSPEP